MKFLKPRLRRSAFLLAFCALLAGLAALPLTSASCRAQQAKPDDPAAYERLRAMTRGGQLPPEQAVAKLAAEQSGTRTGALARLLQARLRVEAKDFAGAASLLDSSEFGQLTGIGDYALFVRAEALEKAGRRVEARAAYEQLAREYPNSMRAREATLRASRMTLEAGQAGAVPIFLKDLAERDDPEALFLTARAHEQSNDPLRALAAWRRLYFYAPVSAPNDAEAAAAFARLSSTSAPASAEEAITRAEKLYEARRYSDAVNAYGESFGRFPETATPQAQLRRGIAAYNARRTVETLAALNAIPSEARELRAEALHYLVLHHARAKQWDAARTVTEEMRRAFASNVLTARALVAAGIAARDARNRTDALNFFRAAVQTLPSSGETANAQFELAWAEHEANRFAEASRLLIEHLADYADKNTDNRGRAGYWAARDSERAGKLAEARALYEAMLGRYDANWYGHLAKQRLEALDRQNVPRTSFAPGSSVARAVANLQTVSAAEESAGPAELERVARADELNAVGLDQLAHAELDKALEAAPESPRVRLAKARIHRGYNENVQAFSVLRRSFPDYSQMKPEELTAEEWDVFYPLSHWETIVQESRSKNLDPYVVAGLIRQESVFNPRAASHANAYGMMQLLVPTAQATARRYGVSQPINVEALFEPRLNIRLGTGYLRDNLDKFGRIEYTAAAYNAGPGRAVAWRASLPLQIDEWTEAIPFRETRGYVQGVIRNMLQYRRLYDEQGRFRPEIGTRAARGTNASPANNSRPRRVSSNEEE